MTPCTDQEALAGGCQYAAVLTTEQWRELRESFGMGIDIYQDFEALRETKALVNYDSLTGSLSIPSRTPGNDSNIRFAFALDERGVVFIDDSGCAAETISKVSAARKWRMPSLERFLYDFLEEIISGDLAALEAMEQTLITMEDNILAEDGKPDLVALSDVRGKLLDLRLHYGQLIDLGLELEENENGFFREENLRYFRLFTQRVERLQDTASSLREYTAQLRDLIQTRIDVRQNRIMTVLTVVTTVFTPLTLITGWYGMNFRYMPELEYPWGYPAVIALSLAVALGSIAWFKKKHWL